MHKKQTQERNPGHFSTIQDISTTSGMSKTQLI